jgi:hypothetical protein
MSSSSPSEDETVLIVSQYVKYVYIAMLTMGIIGNVFNIIVFSNLKVFRHNQCAFYLKVESMINIVAFIYFFIDRNTQYSDGHDLADYSLVWCKLRFFLDQMVQLIPFSIICFIAFDQILSTSHWYTLRQISTLKLAQCLILVTISIASIHSIIFILWMEIIPPIGCSSRNKVMGDYFSFFYYPILVGALPILISSLFSLIAFRNVRHIVRRQVPIVRRRLDRQLTAMVFTRVIVFVVVYLPYVVYRTFTIIKLNTSNYDIPFLFDVLMQMSVILLKDINYAVRYFSVFII